MKLARSVYAMSFSMFALAVACGVFDTAHAQSSAQSSAPTDTLETVVVTGTHISGIAPVGTETVTLDRDAILKSGQLDLTSVVRALPQVTNLGIYREGATQGGYNATQANAINLRGLGIGGTLTLVDGHRLPSTGTVTTLTDANQLPIAMIEKTINALIWITLMAAATAVLPDTPRNAM